MNYSIKQLSDSRWGIYLESKLIVQTRCYYMALKILELLRRKTRKQMKPPQQFSAAV
ncbi:MAG: hypothetical protein QNJ70_17130 [Xenococcaceae cyanobacterium MO_207.B15]|nr:hypothetical protein [Xenococcaceae cyanobacterium MO_207.B15]